MWWFRYRWVTVSPDFSLSFLWHRVGEPFLISVWTWSPVPHWSSPAYTLREGICHCPVGGKVPGSLLDLCDSPSWDIVVSFYSLMRWWKVTPLSGSAGRYRVGPHPFSVASGLSRAVIVSFVSCLACFSCLFGQKEKTFVGSLSSGLFYLQLQVWYTWGKK